jgi:cysteine desulfurase
MMANNETGVVQPVEEIGRIAAEADVWFHTDAVQAAGKLPIDVARIRCDMLSISSHKLNGPQGVGVFYMRRGTPLQPLIVGGPQEHNRRAGTENLAGIAGLGKAVEMASHWLAEGGAQRMAALRDGFERDVSEQVAARALRALPTPRTLPSRGLPARRCWWRSTDGASPFPPVRPAPPAPRIHPMC